MTVARVEPATTANPLGHAVDPGLLLALAQALSGVVPDAYLVTIPAVSFEVGCRSPLARRGAAAALGQIRRMLVAP